MRGTRIALIAIAAIGCGGSSGGAEEPRAKIGVPDMTEQAREEAVRALVVASASHDPARIAERLTVDLTYGGMWFPDADCRQRFASTGTIRAGSFGMFARCLAALTLTTTTRRHPLSNVDVFAYEPGIEIEVLFDVKTSKVRWIGYVGRRSDADILPTVTQAALEAQRIAPANLTFDAATRAPLEEEKKRLAPKARAPHKFGAWLKVCIDAAGAVTSARAHAATSFATGEAYLAIAKAWTFRPFMLGEEASPVCAMFDLAQPGDPHHQVLFPVPLPPAHADAVLVETWSLGERVAGITMVAPDDAEKSAIARQSITKTGAWISFCLAPDGAVDWVQMSHSTGFPGYDARLTRVVASWRFKPQPGELCSRAVFIYSQR
jgi:TonB family protein